MGTASIVACTDNQEEMTINQTEGTCAIVKFHMATIARHEGEHKLIFETVPKTLTECCDRELPAAYLAIT